ncbi:MAG: DUF1028 domain-containing protein [Anaerolineae bacterium]|nr:DUF1028 domain-containing protein [Anaerolineae bacterium]
MTFSIAAYDPNSQAFGVAVASKFLAVASVVSWARADVGAVATQALGKVSFGPDGLSMMAAGKTAQETLAALLAADPQRDHRQVGIVDRDGGAAAHSGTSCFDWKGHRVGEGFTCQGNILTGPETINAMAETFTAAQGELADRLMAALLAGDVAGGDKRGKQSAGLLVVKANGGYGGDNDRYLDLRVDDDLEPVTRLRSLVAMHHIFFGTAKPEDQLVITADIARELQAIMHTGGYWHAEANGVWDEASIQAFWALVGNENLEERWHIENNPSSIDRVALEYLRERFLGK